MKNHRIILPVIMLLTLAVVVYLQLSINQVNGVTGVVQSPTKTVKTETNLEKTEHSELAIQDNLILTDANDNNCIPLAIQKNRLEVAHNQSLQFEEYLQQSDTAESQQMLAMIYLQERKRMRQGELDEQDIEELNNSRINTLNHLLNDDPENKLLNFHFINACIQYPKNDSCSEENLDRAINLDGSNGILWANIASLYIAMGDNEAAIRALNKAHTAPIFDDFRTQRIRFYTDTIIQSGISPDNHKAIAFSFVSAYVPAFPPHVVKICKQLSATRVDIAQACLGYGRRLEFDGSTVITKLIGLELQKAVYNKLNDAQSAMKMQTKHEQIQQSFNESNAKAIEHLYLYNSEFQGYWFDVMSNYNETEAYRFLNEEANRLVNDPSYISCPVN